MTTRNEITGDSIRSKPTTEQYRENFDKIFNKEEKRDGQNNLDREIQTTKNF